MIANSNKNTNKNKETSLFKIGWISCFSKKEQGFGIFYVNTNAFNNCHKKD